MGAKCQLRVSRWFLGTGGLAIRASLGPAHCSKRGLWVHYEEHRKQSPRYTNVGALHVPPEGWRSGLGTREASGGRFVAAVRNDGTGCLVQSPCQSAARAVEAGVPVPQALEP